VIHDVPYKLGTKGIKNKESGGAVNAKKKARSY
jgi:hypothetical protein